jgi:catechol 1,2-dioxygenase
MSQQPGLSRRRFAATALAAIMPGLSPVTRRMFARAAAADAGGACTLTEPLEMGPYHREGAPWQTALVATDEPGQHVVVSGRVIGGDQCEPLADAVVDVWQADASGQYDFQDTPPPQSPDRYRLRGLMLTDRAGQYGFTTVVPGNYSVGTSDLRAKHIHYLIQRTGYEPLITQLYFEGDPQNARDPLVRQSLIKPVEASDAGRRMTFDLVLRREAQIDAPSLRAFGEYLGDYTLPNGARTFRVQWGGGRLVGVFGDELVRLAPDSATQFRVLEWGARATFVRDEQGAIAGLLMSLDDGRQFRLRRAP